MGSRSAGGKGTHLPLDWQVDQLHPDLISADNKLRSLVANPSFGIIPTGIMAQERVQRGQLMTPFPQYPGARLPKQGWDCMRHGTGNEVGRQ